MAAANPLTTASSKATTKAGWGRIEISPNAIMSIPYHNFRVSIYKNDNADDDDEQHQFYYTPLLIIQPKTAKSLVNPFLKLAQVSFTVLMWDRVLEQNLQEALSNKLGKPVPLDSIRPLPIEQIRIEVIEKTPFYDIDNTWQSYAMHADTFTFRVKCADKQSAEDLATNIQEYPSLFVENLLVYYSLETQKTGKRVIQIKAEHAQGGQLFTELIQKFPNEGTVFMRSEDAKRLTMEVATRVIATEITNEEFAGSNEALTISNLLKTALDISAVSSSSFSSEMWGSVFWHEDNARPDVVTQALNELYDKSDNTTKEAIKQEIVKYSQSVDAQAASSESSSEQHGSTTSSSMSSNSQQASSDTSAKVSGSGWGVQANVEASHAQSAQSAATQSANQAASSGEQQSSRVTSNSSASAGSSFSSRDERDQLKSLMKDAKEVSQWNGQKFIPKPMSLSRVNLSALKNSTTIATAQVTVTRTTSELSSRINVVDPELLQVIPVVKHIPAVVVTPEPKQKPKRRLVDEIKRKAKLMTPVNSKVHQHIYQCNLKPFEEDSKNGLRKYQVGPPSHEPAPSKVILVLGATGAGKTTLINGMMNYFFKVEWEDLARFKVIVEEGEADQSKSVTKFISSYQVHRQMDSPSPYSITVIDTPGFGDTSGMQRDREITAQLKQLFSQNNPNFKGIDQIDAICIVVQSALARLTATQRYIFDCILAIFGKDIEENIFLLCTFADDKDPPVLAAVNDAKLKYKDWFPFNNSALYANNEDSSAMFSKLYWQMGTISMQKFFKFLGQVQPKSLMLTREVLKERENLETAVSGLQPQITLGLSKMEEIRQLKEQVSHNERKIQANQNFTMVVDVIEMKKIDLQQGEYVTNCLQCNFTCHYPCGIPNNDGKAGCWAMASNGCCNVCKGQCHWKQHVNVSYRFELVNRKENRTMEAVRQEYEKAKGEKLTVEGILNEMQKHLEKLELEVTSLIFATNESLARLNEIALRPNVMSTPEYVDILIESEQLEMKPGYKERIKHLKDARRNAEYLEKAKIDLASKQDGTWEKMKKAPKEFAKNIWSTFSTK